MHSRRPEKALKAVLIFCGVTPPRTHDMSHLIRLLPPQVPRPPVVLSASALTEYAVVTRYPDSAVIVAEEDYREALHIAEGVVEWATRVIEA